MSEKRKNVNRILEGGREGLVYQFVISAITHSRCDAKSPYIRSQNLSYHIEFKYEVGVL